MSRDNLFTPKHIPTQISCVIGLGNPGAEYARTPHNIGFEACDALARNLHASYWKSQAGCLVAAAPRGDGSMVYIAKPQGYMNTSGGPVSKLLRELKLTTRDILVLHDDCDMDLGNVKLKWGGGLNGHNGLRSLAQKLQTSDFARLKCGIGRPSGRMSLATYVLTPVRGKQQELFDVAVDAASVTCQKCLANGFQKTLADNS